MSEERLFYHGVMCTRVRHDNGTAALYVDGCAYCEREKASGQVHFPRHWASELCESGKRDHCTCGVCW